MREVDIALACTADPHKFHILDDPSDIDENDFVYVTIKLKPLPMPGKDQPAEEEWAVPAQAFTASDGSRFLKMCDGHLGALHQAR